MNDNTELNWNHPKHKKSTPFASVELCATEVSTNVMPQETKSSSGDSSNKRCRRQQVFGCLTIQSNQLDPELESTSS